MRRSWVELTCDHCGNADYYAPGSVDAAARSHGWIITRDGRHYDTQECYAAGKAGAGDATEAPHET